LHRWKGQGDPKETKVRVRIFGATDVGRVRKINQDSYYINAEQGIAIVADGIGGRKGGEIASSMAVKGIYSEFLKRQNMKESDVPPFLIATIDKVNSQILEKGQDDEAIEGMGTTLNALVFLGDNLYIAHVGDSRTYLYYRNHIWQLTLDHNMEVYIERGWLSKETLGKAARPNALVRALGLTPKCEVDVYEKVVRPHEIYLTCSDGLTGMVSDKKIKSLIREYENKLHALPERLVEEANKGGGKDNITVVISEVLRG
jgi:protein phosphatase